MLWEPGKVLVVEGLDATGKSTLINQLLGRAWEEPGPLLVHQPSGLLPFTRKVYELTESESIGDPLALQLLHLSCHAANLPLIREKRSRRGLVLDRWWWSTVAYGFYGGHLSSRMTRERFDTIVNAVWGGFDADIIVVLLEPHVSDRHNVEEVAEGYRHLIGESETPVLELSALASSVAVDLLLEELRQARIVTGDNSD